MEEKISDSILGIKNSGRALLIVAPLEVDSVIVKTLSQKDMPPVDILKPVPTVVEEKAPPIYSTPIGQLKLCHL